MQTSETVSAKRRITQIIAQRVPGSWASNSKCPTAIRAQTVLKHNEVMTPGRTKMSSTGHIRDWNVVVRQVPGSLVMNAVMHHRHELELHSFRHIEPMKVDVYKLPQAQTAIELSRITKQDV